MRKEIYKVMQKANMELEKKNPDFDKPLSFNENI